MKSFLLDPKMNIAHEYAIRNEFVLWDPSPSSQKAPKKQMNLEYRNIQLNSTSMEVKTVLCQLMG